MNTKALISKIDSDRKQATVYPKTTSLNPLGSSHDKAYATKLHSISTSQKAEENVNKNLFEPIRKLFSKQNTLIQNSQNEIKEVQKTNEIDQPKYLTQNLESLKAQIESSKKLSFLQRKKLKKIIGLLENKYINVEQSIDKAKNTLNELNDPPNIKEFDALSKSLNPETFKKFIQQKSYFAAVNGQKKGHNIMPQLLKRKQLLSINNKE